MSNKTLDKEQRRFRKLVISKALIVPSNPDEAYKWAFDFLLQSNKRVMEEVEKENDILIELGEKCYQSYKKAKGHNQILKEENEQDFYQDFRNLTAYLHGRFSLKNTK